MTMTQTRPPLAASAKQRSFIETLLAEREVTGTAYEGWKPDWSRATSKQASGVITYLLTLPKVVDENQAEADLATREAAVEAPAPRTPQARWDSIPVGANGYGFYALEVDENVTKFFRVERASEGKWAGKTFIKEQASDTLYPIEPRMRAYGYLSEIAQDPDKAGRLYASTFTRCYRCNRGLTDAESRARGLGPDCAGKV